MNKAIDIRAAQARDDVEAVKALFIEYAEFLDEDLCFQGFEREIATFPATYDYLLLARVDDAPAAGVGLVDLGDGACEMKRLYTRDAFRGLGLGRRLCEMLIEEAKARGYNRMRLDTLPRLTTAVALYRGLGFTDISAYYQNPMKDVIYMELRLD